MSKRELQQPGFLPMTSDELRFLGWDGLDILFVTGDAYVDHPAFGVALLGRWLVGHGYRVGVVAQPRWTDTSDIASLRRPRLFAGVTAGALDSMLAHYTAFRKKRHDDAYTPGGRHGRRPNRATIVYSNLVRHAFPGLPVVIGGVEASMRRVTHYDFWTDSLRRSILLDSKADLLIYGMAELAILEVAHRLEEAVSTASKTKPPPRSKVACCLAGIAGSVWVGDPEEIVPPGAMLWRLPTHQEIAAQPKRLMEATLTLERQVHQGDAWAVQSAGGSTLVLAPPARALSTEELDRFYSLPFARSAHPSYVEPVPAVATIRFSLTTHRGCAGGCTFCSIALHQGRHIASRSASSLVGEVERLMEHPAWHGSISDVGGPSANMWGAICTLSYEECRRASCLFPELCPHFQDDQSGLADLLREIAALPGVRHVRTASGVRHDLALRSEVYMKALVQEFTGGQMKLAPEHLSEQVLKLMRKPPFRHFESFLDAFQQLSCDAGKEQYVVPYLLSAFPGCTDDDMRRLASWLIRRGWRPEQVQCFIPTPGAVATAMYYGGVDLEGKPIIVARSDAQRLRQHRILVGRPSAGPEVSSTRRRHQRRTRRRE